MSAIYIQLEVESDAVVSRSSATFGGHESLDYLPGATLRGAFASYLNRTANSLIDAALFSGRLRFGPAYPMAADGSAALPVPRSWHRKKGASLDATRDLSTSRPADGEQVVQLRDGYVAGAELISVDKAFTMRTATDREGRASDGLLFGYQAIRAGQHFVARIDVDDPAIMPHVEAWLATGKVRLGRSRSAEFGTVRLSTTRAQAHDVLRNGAPTADGLFGYCFSDILLRDAATGTPTLAPSPAHFGLKTGEFDPTRSYLRTRAYSPFNGERKRPDLERQVIEAGSVIVFKKVAPSETSALLARPPEPFGEAVEEGLGQVVWNPKFLTPPSGLADAKREKSDRKKQTTAHGAPVDALGSFVDGLVLAARRDAEFDSIITPLGNVLREFRIPASQWGVLRDIGRAGGHFDTVRDALRKQISEARGVSAQLIWTRRVGTTSAAKELDEAIEKLPGHLKGDVGVLLERLAARMMRENRGVDRV